MKTKWESITLAPAFGKVPLGGGKASLPEFKDKTRNLIKYHAPDLAGLFCLDVSWNVQSAVGEEDHWQMHWHGVVGGLTPEAKQSLREALKRDADPYSRPLLTEPLTTPARQLAYMAKPNFIRRVALVKADGRRNTRKESLSLAQEVVLACWLSSYRVEQRFLQIGEVVPTT